MTNEEKILDLLLIMQKDIAELKDDVSTLKGDVSTLKDDVTTLKGDVTTLKSGQARLETKVDRLAENQVGDTYTLMQLTYNIADEIRKNQYVMQDDLSYLIKKTVDNSPDIQHLKRVK